MKEENIPLYLLKSWHMEKNREKTNIKPYLCRVQ